MINKTTIIIGVIIFDLALPLSGLALQMPGYVEGANITQTDDGITAQSYVVVNVDSGQILAQKNPDQLWVPASLTKLVTALVVLDTNPDLQKTVAMSGVDEVGGARIIARAGVKFTVDGLFHAALIPSANNAAHALARSTGLSQTDFVALMNQKAASLGAVHTRFNEPTGMDPANITTAADYAKILQAAFKSSYLQTIATTAKYTLRPTNNKKYTQTLKNTDLLLGSDGLTVIGAKTGYLNESLHNFAIQLKDNLGNNLIVVLLGSLRARTEFAEAQKLVDMATATLAFSNIGQAVLGTSTSVSTVNSIISASGASN
jgi:D-alanyl-D-alanine carboxypeptidase